MIKLLNMEKNIENHTGEQNRFPALAEIMVVVLFVRVTELMQIEKGYKVQ